MKTEKGDLTNNSLARFLSIETIGSLVAMAFIFGMGYNALAAEDEKTKEKIAGMQQGQEKLAIDVQQIQTDVAVIKNDQRHVRRQLAEQKEGINRVLMLLEKHNYP